MNNRPKVGDKVSTAVALADMKANHGARYQIEYGIEQYRYTHQGRQFLSSTSHTWEKPCTYYGTPDDVEFSRRTYNVVRLPDERPAVGETVPALVAFDDMAAHPEARYSIHGTPGRVVEGRLSWDNGWSLTRDRLSLSVETFKRLPDAEPKETPEQAEIRRLKGELALATANLASRQAEASKAREEIAGLDAELAHFRSRLYAAQDQARYWHEAYENLAKSMELDALTSARIAQNTLAQAKNHPRKPSGC